MGSLDHGAKYQLEPEDRLDHLIDHSFELAAANANRLDHSIELEPEELGARKQLKDEELGPKEEAAFHISNGLMTRVKKKLLYQTITTLLQQIDGSLKHEACPTTLVVIKAFSATTMEVKCWLEFLDWVRRRVTGGTCEGKPGNGLHDWGRLEALDRLRATTCGSSFTTNVPESPSSTAASSKSGASTAASGAESFQKCHMTACSLLIYVAIAWLKMVPM
ncbi:hypothetical protein ISN45_Aa06g029880 [Arabidopsis thaliana x Arabidopsis arenosa]|uniref:Uncharacterized protein n=1 Tax=Arabidopsis thaliana x Arabidopsis arenosa TaxID=1240361 RepID=A0A8T1Z1T7_9BRAS|nr:hypothetical protein ISN45_Aa06g029880 [Arabidopsis thaliana x Arabidopsis arenosa]